MNISWPFPLPPPKVGPCPLPPKMRLLVAVGTHFSLRSREKMKMLLWGSETQPPLELQGWLVNPPIVFPNSVRTSTRVLPSPSHFSWKAEALKSFSEALQRRFILTGLPRMVLRQSSCSLLSSSTRLLEHLAMMELQCQNCQMPGQRGFCRILLSRESSCSSSRLLVVEKDQQRLRLRSSRWLMVDLRVLWYMSSRVLEDRQAELSEVVFLSLFQRSLASLPFMHRELFFSNISSTILTNLSSRLPKRCLEGSSCLPPCSCLMKLSSSSQRVRVNLFWRALRLLRREVTALRETVEHMRWASHLQSSHSRSLQMRAFSGQLGLMQSLQMSWRPSQAMPAGSQREQSLRRASLVQSGRGWVAMSYKYFRDYISKYLFC